MTKADVKIWADKVGMSKEVLEKLESKYDVEKMTDVVERSSNPDEAIKAIHELYPDIDATELKKQYDFYEAQFNASEEKLDKPMELTDGELENVAGGAANWWSRNWKKFVVGLAIAVAGVLLGGGLGLAGVVGVGKAIMIGVAGLGVAAGVSGMAMGENGKVNINEEDWRTGK